MATSFNHRYKHKQFSNYIDSIVQIPFSKIFNEVNDTIDIINYIKQKKNTDVYLKVINLDLRNISSIINSVMFSF